ncbi:hypothetical protein [Streptomyces sp. NPDC001604]|uniref:hypothetical protein n=1 Tax=Streptomyces sp. NPDC001604 TaxID=3364593 RepID=UPI0036C94AA0
MVLPGAGEVLGEGEGEDEAQDVLGGRLLVDLAGVGQDIVRIVRQGGEQIYVP